MRCKLELFGELDFSLMITFVRQDSCYIHYHKIQWSSINLELQLRTHAAHLGI